MASTSRWLAAAGILGGALFLARKQVGSALGPALRVPMPAPFKGVPFARGAGRFWPVDTSDDRRFVVSYKDVHGETHGNPERRFGATRSGRYHVGIDLYGDAGDVVRATEGGKVLFIQTFHLGSWAIAVLHDSGVVVLYGEVKADSWKPFGVAEGSRVSAGQPIARVALMSSGSHMLHLETYRCCPTENEPWFQGKPAPAQVLDPTLYLLEIANRTAPVAA